MTKLFRIISCAEGLSYLVILSVTIGIISRDFVFVLGMTHGVLFMVYMVLSLLVCNQKEWSVIKWLALFLAAIVPFAFLPVEWVLRKEANPPLPEASAA